MKVKKIMCFVMVFLILILTTATYGYTANASEQKLQKLLFILQQSSDLDNIKTSEIIDTSSFDIVDFKTIKDYSKKDLTSYQAIAIPYSEARKNAKILRSIYESGGIIYIYGSLTIADFKKALKLDKFGVTVPIYDPKGHDTSKKAFQYFSDDQEKNDIVNVICLTREGQGLLSYIEESDKGYIEPYQFYKAVIDDIQKFGIQQGFKTMGVEIVKSGFGFYSYYWNSRSCTYMDYTLYRNFDESDPTYDYFAISTNVWARCTSTDPLGVISEVTVKHALPYSVDELIDHSPGDIYSAGSVGVSVDVGGVSFGFSYELSGNPRIYCNENYTSDVVEWQMLPRLVSPVYLDNKVFKSATSWASTATYAGIDITFNSTTNYGAPNLQYPVVGTPKTVQVRYDY